MAALLALPRADATVGAAPNAALTVKGTAFRVALRDGKTLLSPDLVGVVLEAMDDAGQPLTIRIDGVRLDASAPGGDIWLHSLSTRDRVTGEWRELCGPAPDGTVAGFPLAGRWTSDGRHLQDARAFSITCASGAIGKCVRFGYRPWAEVGGRPLWHYHQACVRLLRADYGGDGTAHTRDGTLIDLYDEIGIQRPDVAARGLSFEAAWGPNGAVCVRRTRISDLLTIETLAAKYPRVANGPDCSEMTSALLWNRS
ncbi:ADYC domain-containing protein [Paracraurococcus lichenis]|uniref:ADYC domain-containing protein n=1 Tax=Paracraurococcus lichenis TaxID=3064888 RepID=A0ABT9EAW7_9PROT|nr:ADYC domain-containing protein [Paracraurococcus sp. LOR1-02]MDO9713353.1 ADYC domain-containing protein [Paracraurococcus sp. LOR1-02]